MMTSKYLLLPAQHVQSSKWNKCGIKVVQGGVLLSVSWDHVLALPTPPSKASCPACGNLPHQGTGPENLSPERETNATLGSVKWKENQAVGRTVEKIWDTTQVSDTKLIWDSEAGGELLGQPHSGRLHPYSKRRYPLHIPGINEAINTGKKVSSFLFSWDRVSHCNAGWPWTCFDLSASASQGLVL